MGSLRTLHLAPYTPHAAFAATHVATSAPLSSAVFAVSFLSVVCPTHPHLSYIALLRPFVAGALAIPIACAEEYAMVLHRLCCPTLCGLRCEECT